MLYPRHSLKEFYSSAEIQLMYSTAPADWATGHSLRESYHSAEMQLMYSTALADWDTRHSLKESYHSAEMQLMYSTAPANWDTGHSLRESYHSAEMQLMYSTALAVWDTGHSLSESYHSSRLCQIGYLLSSPLPKQKWQFNCPVCLDNIWWKFNIWAFSIFLYKLHSSPIKENTVNKIIRNWISS